MHAGHFVVVALVLPLFKSTKCGHVFTQVVAHYKHCSTCFKHCSACFPPEHRELPCFSMDTDHCMNVASFNSTNSALAGILIVFSLLLRMTLQFRALSVAHAFDAKLPVFHTCVAVCFGGRFLEVGILG